MGLAIEDPGVKDIHLQFCRSSKLLERAGNSDKGSITGVYTVLVDGDDLTEPVTDTAREILMSILFVKPGCNQYPAIDV